MRNVIAAISLAITFTNLFGQLKLADYRRYDSILVIRSGDTMLNPWVGGINNAQFSEWDINKDGYMDLFVFDKDHSSLKGIYKYS